MAEEKDKDKVLGYQGLGDISKLMHNQGVSDLSWLAVDEEDYRASETLPKQNLDIIPEFQKALISEGDERVPALIPLRPHTIVNSNPLDRSYGNSASAYNLVPVETIVKRVASYVMANLPSSIMANRLQQEFSLKDLHAAGQQASEIINERGLIGNVYVDAKYFSDCSQLGSADQKFATTVTRRASLILAAPKCTGCVCNNNGICSSLKKRIVSKVNYGPNLASSLNSRLVNEGRSIDASEVSDWKEHIREAFLKSPVAMRETSPQTIQNLPKPISKPAITASDVQEFITRKTTNSGIDKMPSVQYLKFARQVTLGHQLDSSMLAASTDPEIRTLANEYGILGHTYLDMDALGGCNKTLQFVKETNCKPDFILRRSISCDNCKCISDGACAGLCKVAPVVTEKPDLDSRNFVSALHRAIVDKRISQEQAKIAANRVAAQSNPVWGRVVAAANLYKSADKSATQYSGYKVTTHNGDPGRSLGSELMNAEEVRRTISHMMNTGLNGKHLQAAVLQRYSRTDLAQVPEIGVNLSTNDGIQGRYFIDPTAYADYGKGCTAGSKRFRKCGPPHVFASNACTGCVLQTHPGWCSKYSKNLIQNVPTEVTTKITIPTVASVSVENPVEKYELDSELTVETSANKPKSIEISFADRKVDV
jgi:hypothetical protein